MNNSQGGSVPDTMHKIATKISFQKNKERKIAVQWEKQHVNLSIKKVPSYTIQDLPNIPFT